MAVLQQCPNCKKRQGINNDLCKCGVDLAQARRAKDQVRFWVVYRLRNGKQKWELAGYSLTDAKNLDQDKGYLKRNKPAALTKPKDLTFSELTEWFLSLEKVKSLAYYQTLQYNLNSFNAEFGDILISEIRPADLVNFQIAQKALGLSDSYVDQLVGAARTMVNKAFNNDLVDIQSVSFFKKVAKLLKRNSNARDRILTPDEYKRLMQNLPKHLEGVVATAYFTGMRKAEILGLTWDKVDLKRRVIQLEAEDTKDREKRSVPICNELLEILMALPTRSPGKVYVFQYAGQPIQDIREGLRRTCRDAKINYGRSAKDGFTFHDLRHTYCTNMRKAGVPEGVIMKLTGHSTREMFDRYDTVDLEDAQKAVKQLQNYLEKMS